MPRAKPLLLSEMVDTDMEEKTPNADAFPTPDSNQENAGAVKKKGARLKANAKKFTKPKRLSGSSVAARTAAAPKTRAGRKRAPLKDQTNNKHAEDTEEVDEFAAQTEEGGLAAAMDEVVDLKPKAKRKASEKKTSRPPERQVTTHLNAVEKDGEFEYTPTAVRQKTLGREKNVGKDKASVRQASRGPTTERVIQETQVPMEVDSSAMREQDDLDEQAIPQSVFRRSNNAIVTSRQRPVARRRACSASSTERAAGDPGLRRKLGEMTRKFESLELKYRDLRDVVSKEAEANYDKLKAHSEAKAKDELIVSLKKEIATQKALAQESQSIQEQIHSRDNDLAKTQALANQLSTSLAEAQNENRALHAKLANSRSASVAVENRGSKTPGSAVKGKNQAAARKTMVGSAEVVHASQIAQLKEDLYSDLTGLILRGVDIGSDADTYDCIQTGRNGTLHFKLAIAKESEDSYENTEFQYTPRLDSNRDRDLIALLPEYLTDEITFSRTNAAMFYGRVVETLTKRRPTESQE
ncbi:MAG: hypothetical protein Q9217_002371 [Psora testacea]